MSDEIVVGYHIDYRATIQQLLQQKDSRFESSVMVETFTGKQARPVEQVGAVTAQKRTTRHADTPLIPTPHSARWVFPSDYEWADLIDDQDKLRRLADPTSAYVMNGVSAMQRAKDDEIIAAFFATSKTGENGSTDEAFDTANYQVAVTEGAGAATGMNVAKLRVAKRMLMEAEVDVDMEPLYCAIEAKQHDNLLAETQAISLDFNDRPVLVDGRIKSFMGFNFLDSQRLSVTADPYRRCPVWAKSGMVLGKWEDVTTRVTERDDKSYATQVYVRGTFGSTRLEQGKVIDILCAE